MRSLLLLAASVAAQYEAPAPAPAAYVAPPPAAPSYVSPSAYAAPVPFALQAGQCQTAAMGVCRNYLFKSFAEHAPQYLADAPKPPK